MVPLCLQVDNTVTGINVGPADSGGGTGGGGIAIFTEIYVTTNKTAK